MSNKRLAILVLLTGFSILHCNGQFNPSIPITYYAIQLGSGLDTHFGVTDGASGYNGHSALIQTYSAMWLPQGRTDLAHYDAMGNVIFEQRLNDQLSDYHTCIASDSSIWVTARNYPDLIVSRISPTGNLIWSRTLYNMCFGFMDIIPDTSGNAFIQTNGRLIKMDSLGNLVWVKASNCSVFQLSPDHRLGLRIGGKMVKVDFNGNVVQAKTAYPGTACFGEDYFVFVQGVTANQGTRVHFVDTTGVLQWMTEFSHSTDPSNIVTGVVADQGTGTIMVALRYYDSVQGNNPNCITYFGQKFSVAILDLDGNLLRITDYNPAANRFEQLNAFERGVNDELIMACNITHLYPILSPCYDPRETEGYFRKVSMATNCLGGGGHPFAKTLGPDTILFQTQAMLANDSISSGLFGSIFIQDTIPVYWPARSCYSCPQPYATFDHVTSGLTATFSDSLSDYQSFEWVFGDGSTDSIRNPVHVYPVCGNYHAQLIAGNVCGTDTFSTAIEFVDSARFGFDPIICIEDTVRLHNSSDSTLSYLWHKDGVLIGNNYDIEFIADSAGQYLIMLVVDNGTCTDTMIQTIQVTDTLSNTAISFSSTGLSVVFNVIGCIPLLCNGFEV